MRKILIFGYLLFNLSVAVCQKSIDSLVLVKCMMTDIKATDDTLIYVVPIDVYRISGGFKLENNEIIFDTYTPHSRSIRKTGKYKFSIYKNSIKKDTFMIFCFLKDKKLYHYLDLDYFQNSIMEVFPYDPLWSAAKLSKSYTHAVNIYFDAYDAYYLPNFNDRVEKLKIIIEKQNSGAFLVLLNNLLNGYRGVNLGEGDDIADSILFYPKDERIKIQIYKDWLRNDSLSFFFKQRVDGLLCKNANTNINSYRYKYEERIGYFETMLLHIKENCKLPEEEKEKQINEVKSYLSQILHDLELRIPFYTSENQTFQKNIDRLKKLLEE